MKKSFIILFAALVIFAGCYPIPEPEEEIFGPSATTLTEGVWTAGYLGTADEEQWFKFTASANLHFVHFGDINNSLRVQFYNSEGKTIGSGGEIKDFSMYVKYISYSSFTAGEEYYVKVQRDDFYSNSVCKFNIAFNKSETPPVTIKLPSNATELTVDTPADGNISDDVKEQWFKFIATAETQYIHVILGGLGGLSYAEVQLYKVKDGTLGDPLGATINLPDNGKNYVKKTLTVGDEYYIKISPQYYSSKGTYQIAFNALFVPPPTTNIKQLTFDTWANDSFTANSKDHWFFFTATNATQYIHVDINEDGNTLSFQGLDIILYDENGNTVDSLTNLSNSRKYTSRSLTPEQD